MPLRLQAWLCRIIFHPQDIPIDSVIKGEIKYYHVVQVHGHVCTDRFKNHLYESYFSIVAFVHIHCPPQNLCVIKINCVHKFPCRIVTSHIHSILVHY